MKLYKSKSATKNAIYKIVYPLTKGIFVDDDWRNVTRIWKNLEANGVSVSIESARYDEFNCPPTFKRWHFTAEVNGFTFTGTLVASFCGTVQDPTDRYDICFII